MCEFHRGWCAITCGVMVLSGVLAGGIATGPVHAGEGATGRTHVVSRGEDVQSRLQEVLIEAAPGDTIELEAGRYELTHELDIVADNVTIRGRGSQQTVLSFKGQTSGGQGISATGNNFVLEGLAVEDTAGNAIKVLGSRNVTLRDVRAEWTGPASSGNGAYGIYPVQCQNVLVENCSAYGASDAGLYVGQCHDVVLRGCRAERNVAGIEIENTVGADVYENVAENNTGGILVFDLPGLQVKAGKNVRVFKNRVSSNNHENFADPGSIVSQVPPGTGVMVLATDSVEVFENTIEESQTASVLVLSYLSVNPRINDASYDPIPVAISIHDNRISGGGQKPGGMLAQLLRPVLGKQFPDILWDGVVDPQAKGGGPRIVNNGEASFANFRLPELTEANLKDGKYSVDTDVSKYALELPTWKPIQLKPHEPPTDQISTAVQVYRSLPRKLSDYGLFRGELRQQQPAEGVVLYGLNAELFSDYAFKRRFIRLPKEGKIEYRREGVLKFPVGTIIAKTFSYPHDLRDVQGGERILETRIELLRDTGWYGVSYLWNDDQTDAEFALGGKELDVSWIHTDGARKRIRYEVPNANQCITCHSLDKEFVPIGPTAKNLNRPSAADHGGTNQLERLAELQLLAGLPKSNEVPKLPDLSDLHSGNIEQRARAWLDVNCAHCHRPEGTARTTGLDLRTEQGDLAKVGLWKSPVAAGSGSGGRRFDIVPGRPDESILIYRLESEEPKGMMPNLGRRLVHREGVELVRQWIGSLPAKQ